MAVFYYMVEIESLGLLIINADCNMMYFNVQTTFYHMGLMLIHPVFKGR